MSKWFKWLRLLINKFMSKKISELPAATLPLQDGDRLAIVQAGVTVQAAISSLSAGGPNVAYRDVDNHFIVGQTFHGPITATHGTLSALTINNGYNTIAIGTHNTLLSGGSDNVILATKVNYGGSENVIIGGSFTGYNTRTAGSVLIGSDAGNNLRSNNQVFVGMYAGYATSTGSNNTFVGSFAGSNNQTGSNNVVLGINQIQNGNSNILIGNGMVDFDDGNCNIFIGTENNPPDGGNSNIWFGRGIVASNNNLSGTVVLATSANPNTNNQFILGSNAVPILTSASTVLAAQPETFMRITFNGRSLKIPLYT